MSRQFQKMNSTREKIAEAINNEAAIGRSLRRLSELIDRDATRVYQALGISFEQRWFGVLNQLRLNGEMSVTEIASALLITHASVSETRRSLMSANFIQTKRDEKDGRQRILSLTDAGIEFTKSMAPVWEAMEQASIELNREAKKIAEALDSLDQALQRKSFFQRAMVKIE